MESSKISVNDIEDDVAMDGFSDVQKGCPKCYINESTQNTGLLARRRKDTEDRFKFQTFLCLVWSFFILASVLIIYCVYQSEFPRNTVCRTIIFESVVQCRVGVAYN